MRKLTFLSILIFSFSGFRITAQVATTYSWSIAGAAFTPVAGGTTLASGTGASMDDVIYTSQPIGFTFTYNNVAYTTLGVSTNGFIWFGSTNPSNTDYSPVSSVTGMSGVISAFALDLVGCSGTSANPATPSIKIVTTGSAPNRIFTIEWNAVRAKTSGTIGFCTAFGYLDVNRVDLQIKLYESLNKIDVCFNDAPYCVDGSYSGQVGLRGSTNADYNNCGVACGNQWNNPTLGSFNTNATTCQINGNSCNNYPTSGTVYSWSPAAPPPAQPNCTYGFSYTTAGYVALSGATVLGSGTTAIDEVAWPNQNIGFTYYFNGSPYTQLGVTSNGWIWFGAIGPTGSGSTLNPQTMVLNSTAGMDGIIAGLNGDLIGRNSTGVISTKLSGSAPNRIFTIEYLNVRPKSATNGSGNINRTDLQIILTETTNTIQFAYNIYPYPYQTSYNQTFQVGIRGASNADNFVRSVIPGSNDWTSSTQGTATSTCGVNANVPFLFGTYPPTSARYVFTPAAAGLITWNGSSSTDWFTAANWSPAVVPQPCNDVLIPVVGTTLYPLVTNASLFATCRNLTVNSGATLTLATGYAQTLQVGGSVVNNGTIIDNGSTPIYLAGGASKTIGGTGNFLQASFSIVYNSYYSLTNSLTGSTSSLGKMYITSGSTFNLAGFDFTVDYICQTGILLQSTGTLSIEDIAGISVLTDATFNEGTGTTYFSAGTVFPVGNQLVPSITYYNLIVRTNNGFTVTIGTSADFTCNNLDIRNIGGIGGIASTARNITVNGNFILGNTPSYIGVNLLLNNCIQRTSGTGTFTMGNDDNNFITVTKSSILGPQAAALSGFGALNFYSTVYYNCTPDQTAMSGFYKNIQILSGTGSRIMNGDITLSGNLTISAGTLYANVAGYNIYVAGHWTNTATFNSSLGTVTFNGTANQNIQSGYSSFYNVVINNPAGITLVADNLPISNNLTLTNGMVTTNAMKVDVSTPNASAVVAGGSNTNFSISWINGNLGRNFAYNNSIYYFPVGDAANPHLAEIDNNYLDDVTYIDSKFGPKPGTDAGLNVTEMNIGSYTSVNSAGVWYIEPDWAPSSGSYDLKLYLNTFAGLTNNQFAILSRISSSSNGADWTTGGGTLNANGGLGRMTADGYALRIGLTSFSQKGIGMSNTGLPTPITLISFMGDEEPQFNHLTWETASEINSELFEVQGSKDGYFFQPLGSVPAAGFSTIMHNYFFDDVSPSNAINYYRLKLKDLDESYTYSSVVMLDNRLSSFKVVLIPNPVTSNSTLLISSFSLSSLDLELTDALGKIIWVKKAALHPGENAIALDLQSLSEAVYFLHCENAAEQFSKTIKIIKD